MTSFWARVRVGHIRQGESTDAGIAVSNGDGLRGSPSLAEWSMCARWAEAKTRPLSDALVALSQECPRTPAGGQGKRLPV